MATKAEVQGLLDAGLGYQEVADRLGIPAGQAYLIATGRPADGGAEPATRDDDGGPEGGSNQPLADPPHYNPTSSPQVHDWMAEQARADQPMQDAQHEQDRPDP